ncbi:MAG: RluA family pseudouridine synthase, partial [Pseudomonadota bacterium]
MAGVQTVEVEEDAQDMRLDRWFRGRFPHVSQGRIEKMCRKGEIRVDGGRVRAATRLNPGQTVRIPPLPEAGPKPSAPTQPDALPQNEVTRLRAAVLFEDDHVIALNKPAGLAVQGGSRTPIHLDMLSAALVPDGAPKPKLIHRLDRDTSGVLVLAKTGSAAAALAKSFQSRATRKIYWAAVAGVPHPRAGSIRYGLVKAPGHGPHGAGEKMNC